MSDLFTATNPFAVLEVTPGDNRATLDHALSRARLLGDAKQATVAHQKLVNLSQRVGAEVTWLPGLTAEQHKLAENALVEGRVSKEMLDQMPPLARANLMLALTEMELDQGGGVDDELVAILCVDVISSWSAVTADEVFRDLNIDRERSGFSPLAETEPIRIALSQLADSFRKVLRRVLNLISRPARAEVLIHCLTRDDSRPSPLLLSLIDDYEKESEADVAAALEDVKSVLSLVEQLLDSKAPSSAITFQVEELIAAIYAWDEIVQPVQLARQRQLKQHAPTIDLHKTLRGVALRLHNDRGLTRVSKKLTDCFANVFQEERDVVEAVSADLSQLDEILESRKPEARKKTARWRKAVTWESRSRDTHLRISPAGIEYGYETIRLEDINRFRLLNHPRLGIRVEGPTEWLDIFFSSSKSINAFIDRLVTGVGDDIHYAWHLALQSGGVVRVGTVRVVDEGLVIPRPRFLRASEEVKVPWARVRLSSGQGGLGFSDSADEKVSTFLSYFSVDNAIVLEALLKRIRATKDRCISDLY